VLILQLWNLPKVYWLCGILIIEIHHMFPRDFLAIALNKYKIITYPYAHFLWLGFKTTHTKKHTYSGVFGLEKLFLIVFSKCGGSDMK